MNFLNFLAEKKVSIVESAAENVKLEQLSCIYTLTTVLRNEEVTFDNNRSGSREVQGVANDSEQPTHLHTRLATARACYICGFYLWLAVDKLCFVTTDHTPSSMYSNMVLAIYNMNQLYIHHTTVNCCSAARCADRVCLQSTAAASLYNIIDWKVFHLPAKD